MKQLSWAVTGREILMTAARRSTWIAAATAAMLALTSAASATSITFDATNATGGTGNTAVSASAAFTTSAGLLSVTITNLLDPGAIISSAQAVSDLSFTLSNAPGALGATSATGQLANFACAPCTTVTNVSGSPLRWLGQGPPLRAAQVLSPLQVTPSRWTRSGAVCQISWSYLWLRVSQMAIWV
jgi:hypothetical protein